jgi:hypothetical protein
MSKMYVNAPVLKTFFTFQEASEVGGGIYWAQRPMPGHLVNALAAEATALFPILHENLLR